MHAFVQRLDFEKFLSVPCARLHHHSLSSPFASRHCESLHFLSCFTLSIGNGETCRLGGLDATTSDAGRWEKTSFRALFLSRQFHFNHRIIGRALATTKMVCDAIIQREILIFLTLLSCYCSLSWDECNKTVFNSDFSVCRFVEIVRCCTFMELTGENISLKLGGRSKHPFCAESNLSWLFLDVRESSSSLW